MTDYELEKINIERRRKGLLPLSRTQAELAIDSHPRYERDTSFDFLFGYLTGVPLPSGAGIVGAMMHSSETTTSSASYSSPESDTQSSGSFGGGGASSSWSDNSSSSSSSDSSSSSSSDSGSSSSSSSD